VSVVCFTLSYLLPDRGSERAARNR
jgi:hypothetical protein